MNATNDLHFAVVAGINRYPGMRTQLKSAKSDARLFYEWLVDPSGGAVPEKQACFVATKDEEENKYASHIDAKPVRSQVNYALHEMHGKVDAEIRRHRGAWEKTRLYIYLAGHGIAPPGGRGALLFADSSPTGYWGDYLDLLQYDLYYEKQYLFREVILFADCCRETYGGMPPVSAPPFGRYKEPPESPRRVVGFATAWKKKAYEPVRHDEDDSNGRGFFTRALLEGLKGKAADSVTGKVDVTDLNSYVKARVSELAGKVNRRQNAEIGGSPDTVLCTVPLNPEKTYPVEISLPANWTSATHIEANGRRYSDWPGGGAAWRVELPSGVYEIISAGPDKISEDKETFKVHAEGRRVHLT